MESDPGTHPRRSKAVKTIVLGFAAALALAAVAGGSIWALTCPCEGTPGFVLPGDLNEEPVTDWTFANRRSALSDPDQYRVEAPLAEPELHGVTGRRALPQLLVRRAQVLVSSGAARPSGPPST